MQILFIICYIVYHLKNAQFSIENGINIMKNKTESNKHLSFSSCIIIVEQLGNEWNDISRLNIDSS